MIVRVLVAAGVFVLAVDGGTYGVASRHSLAIAVWWTILVGVAVGLWPRARPSRLGLVAGTSLGAFVLWTGASIAWASGAERAFLEFDRSALFLGVFVLAAIGPMRKDVRVVGEGVALGLSAVAALALASRLFADLFPEPDLVRFLPGARGRLTFPVNYWNGLGILVSLAVPLLVNAAATAAKPAVRAVAIIPLPLIASAIFLTSSRGGVATALLGTVVLLALTDRRAATFGALAVATLGSAAAVALLDAHGELVGGLESAAQTEGRLVTVLLAGISVGIGLLYLAVLRQVRMPAIPPRLGWVAFACGTAVTAAIVVLADPARRLEEFEQAPTESSLPDPGFVQAHLLSGAGSGRWQFWSAAVDQFEAHPLIGAGAGSFEAWWAEHGSIPYFVRDAHSLYLETLAELGLIGFILLATFFASALAAGLSTLRRDGSDRATVAALTGVAVAFAFSAAIDWMWELTVVSVVGFAALGLLAAATQAGETWRGSLAAGLAAVTAAWFIICAEVLPLLTQLEIQQSQAAVRQGDVRPALEHAQSARDLQPWAASPYLQLALVDEQRGALRPARAAILAALDRDPYDWRLWLVAARIETKAGRLMDARRSLSRAIALNPRSPLFAERGG